MSCPKTQHLLQEYFSDELAPVVRDELDKHLSECSHCSTELELLLMAQGNLQQWQEKQVPHWDRGLTLFRQEHKTISNASGFWSRWQWLPTAASFVMLCVLVFNFSIVTDDNGLTISFGGSPTSSSSIQSQLAEFQQLQNAEMQALVARIEDRADSNNVQLMQAVLEQTQRSTAESFDQIYSYFEQQRLLDLQDMRVGYEQLADSDYKTIRSLQQLVNFVGYQSDIR
ncbi:MAG: hypothetical protein COA96_12205 [SAR86 cluster bacterium]|uniref:Putative zinc-finger domain-containing protein n=1 Tax=SAR86 cluster bacterium TaxID=2030880 RepID=A0A2A5AWS0_9GAMM|nr:MAG: hypothetical protein COA96_12205 [SAR86 cluster bacterium]